MDGTSRSVDRSDLAGLTMSSVQTASNFSSEDDADPLRLQASVDSAREQLRQQKSLNKETKRQQAELASCANVLVAEVERLRRQDSLSQKEIAHIDRIKEKTEQAATQRQSRAHVEKTLQQSKQQEILNKERMVEQLRNQRQEKLRAARQRVQEQARKSGADEREQRNKHRSAIQHSTHTEHLDKCKKAFERRQEKSSAQNKRVESVLQKVEERKKDMVDTLANTGGSVQTTIERIKSLDDVKDQMLVRAQTVSCQHQALLDEMNTMVRTQRTVALTTRKGASRVVNPDSKDSARTRSESPLQGRRYQTLQRETGGPATPRSVTPNQRSGPRLSTSERGLEDLRVQLERLRASCNLTQPSSSSTLRRTRSQDDHRDKLQQRFTPRPRRAPVEPNSARSSRPGTPNSRTTNRASDVKAPQRMGTRGGSSSSKQIAGGSKSTAVGADLAPEPGRAVSTDQGTPRVSGGGTALGSRVVGAQGDLQASGPKSPNAVHSTTPTRVSKAVQPRGSTLEQGTPVANVSPKAANHLETLEQLEEIVRISSKSPARTASAPSAREAVPETAPETQQSVTQHRAASSVPVPTFSTAQAYDPTKAGIIQRFIEEHRDASGALVTGLRPVATPQPQQPNSPPQPPQPQLSLGGSVMASQAVLKPFANVARTPPTPTIRVMVPGS